MKRTLISLTCLLLVLTMLLIGCSGNTSTAAPASSSSKTESNAAPAAAASSDDKIENLPSVMSWVAYEVGAAGYNQAAAIANGLTKKYNSQVRIVPADTSVGRIMTLQSGQATYGFLADETTFALEGSYDFAAKNFGPQDLRVLLAKPSCYAVAVTKASGITKMEDLRGKRFSYVPGNTSHIVKGAAMLAFGGLTYDDVEVTIMASYSAGMKGLLEGKTLDWKKHKLESRLQGEISITSYM